MNIRTISMFVLLAVAFLLGCGGPPSAAERTASGEMPEITDEVIYERINDAWVRDVMPEEAQNKEPIFWNFDSDEPKEITVVEKQQNGNRATIVLDIKTSSSPRARIQRELAGRIRTEWQLQTGWVIRRWEIVETENISMKYKDTPKAPPDNSNQQSEQQTRTVEVQRR